MDKGNNKKGQLFADLFPQAESPEDQKKIQSFLDRITEEQAAQLLALDGFTEEFKIPIWDADLDGPAKDANREHNSPPDRIIEGTSAPRRIAEDLFILIQTSKSVLDIPVQIELTAKLSETNKKYWEELQKILPVLSSVAGRRPDMIALTVDTINKHFLWSQKKEGNFGSLIKDKNRSKRETFTRCIIDFKALEREGLKITKKLDHKDEAIYTAAANLFYAGNEVFSLSMLYQVYHESQPRGGETEEISERLLKAAKAWLTLDNKDEAEVTKYPYFTYDGSLLPLERITCYINGRLTEQAIHLLREPPLFTYARERGAIVTVEKKYLTPPVNRNARTDQLNTYLLRIIKLAQRDNGITNRITFDTIYEELDLENKSLQSRIKGYVKRLFEFYKEGGLITAYEQDKRGITFFWDSKRLAEKCKKTSGKV